MINFLNEIRARLDDIDMWIEYMVIKHEITL